MIRVMLQILKVRQMFNRPKTQEHHLEHAPDSHRIDNGHQAGSDEGQHDDPRRFRKKRIHGRSNNDRTEQQETDRINQSNQARCQECLELQIEK